MRKIKKIIASIFIIFLFIFVIVNLYLVISKLVFKEEPAKLFGYGLVTVTSGSMEPAISVGDMLLIKEQKEYNKEDIVTFMDQQVLITHRIIEIDPTQQVVTQGDSNNAADAPIGLEQIEGKVMLILPKIGYLPLFLKTKAGIFSLVVIGLLAVWLSTKRSDRENEI